MNRTLKNSLAVIICLFVSSCISWQYEKDDRNYRAFSGELFSYLVDNDTGKVNTRKYYYPSETYWVIEDEAKNPLGKPSVTVKFKVQIDTLEEYTFDNTKNVYMDYEWFPKRNESLDSDKKIPDEDLQVKYQLIAPVNFNRRSKKETYLMGFGDVVLRLRVKCIEGMKYYDDDLKGDLFIKAIFSSINYYHPIYGSISIYKH